MTAARDAMSIGTFAAASLPSHFYVHVPFCASKCGYCDFASVSGADADTMAAVFAGMRTQVTSWELSGLEGVVETIYFGGGTPSLCHGEVIRLLRHLRSALVVHPRAEITVEANPDSIDDAIASELASAGVTRISVGVQSLDDRDLRLLGRRHDSATAVRACESVRAAGLDLAVDLMCGVPGQTRAAWAATLGAAVATGAGHVSVYPLSIEDGTPFGVAVDAGLLAQPDPDFAAECMVLAEAALGYHGFTRYEVANYSRHRETRSRHNTAYWTGRSYAGIGPGAHGMLDSATARVMGLLPEGEPESAVRVRYGNTGDISEWMVGRGDTIEVLSAAEAAREDAMLGLRLVDGISDDLAQRAGARETLEALAEAGLVEHVRDGWRTTSRGWLLGNEVFARVWAGDEPR